MERHSSSIDSVEIIAADFNNRIIIVKSAEYRHSSTFRKLISVPIAAQSERHTLSSETTTFVFSPGTSLEFLTKGKTGTL